MPIALQQERGDWIFAAASLPCSSAAALWWKGQALDISVLTLAEKFMSSEAFIVVSDFSSHAADDPPRNRRTLRVLKQLQSSCSLAALVSTFSSNAICRSEAAASPG